MSLRMLPFVLFAQSAFATPLVLDLAGDGDIDFVAGGVAFDLYGTGESVPLNWPKGEIGLLALDLNGNDAVDSGLELFGDATPLLSDATRTASHGFAALAQYDHDKNGTIDRLDPMFAKLLVWVDRNGDGRSAKDELAPLDRYRIRSLSLGYHPVSGPLEGGFSMPLLMGRYTALDDAGKVTSRVMADVYLRIYEK